MRSILDDAAAPDAIPRAVARPRGGAAHLAALRGAIGRWLAGRVGWLRPRLVPLLFAAGGTLVVLATMDHLARPPQGAAPTPVEHHPVRLTIIVGGR
jgi:hypothetical protein